jgi:hypothetical protein
MARFGIVMSVFNVFVALIVLVLAGLDYGRYRGHALAAFLHEMVITGLPVDDKEMVEAYPSDPTITKLEPEVLKKVFDNNSNLGGADLGGAPVQTVEAELTRVAAKVKANVDAAPNVEQKRTILWRYLQFQARTIVERDEYRKKCFQDPMGAAEQELERRFTYVRQPQNRVEKAANKELRLGAGQLFVNLSVDPEWRKRVMVVVGLEAYVTAVGMQADAFAQIASDIRELTVRDQGNFVVSYENGVRELIYQSEELFRANQRLANLKAVLADRLTALQQRQTEVNEHKADLTKKTADTNTEIARLEAIQRDLFAVQQRLGLAQAETEKLEAELKSKAKP